MSASHEADGSPTSFSTGQWHCQIRESNGSLSELQFIDRGDGQNVSGWLRRASWHQQPGASRGQCADKRHFRASAGTWFCPRRQQGGILLRGQLENGEPLSLRIPATHDQDALFRTGAYRAGRCFIDSDGEGRCFHLTFVDTSHGRSKQIAA